MKIVGKKVFLESDFITFTGCADRQFQSWFFGVQCHLNPKTANILSQLGSKRVGLSREHWNRLPVETFDRRCSFGGLKYDHKCKNGAKEGRFDHFRLQLFFSLIRKRVFQYIGKRFHNLFCSVSVVVKRPNVQKRQYQPIKRQTIAQTHVNGS